MVSVYLGPVYLLLNCFLVWRLLKWLGACTPFFLKKSVKAVTIAVYAFVAASPVLAFLLPSGTVTRRVLETVSNGWLGILLYLLLLVAAAELGGFVLRRVKKPVRQEPGSKKALVITGAVCAVLTLAVSLYGMVNAGIVRVTPYEISVEKDGGPLSEVQVVLAADLHLGYSVGTAAMEQMVEKINAQSPDVVVLAGDIFDNDYEAMDDPEELISILQGIQSKYGVFACYGNHDVAEPILVGFTFDSKEKPVSDPRMDEFLKRAGIRLLQDESVLVADSFYLYGRPDYGKPGRGIEVRKTPSELTAGLDPEKPLLVIDHEPKELDALAAAGVDVDLAGHTHAGQVFPGNLVISLFAENAYGYQLRGEMHSIVTSGVGLFGPNMRVGTIAEICPVTVRFQ